MPGPVPGIALSVSLCLRTWMAGACPAMTPLCLLGDGDDDAGADGLAALADGEALLLLHRDRRDRARRPSSTLSPGITISVPSGSVHCPVTSVVRK